MIAQGENMSGTYTINEFLQNQLKQKGLNTISANEAASWLDRAGLLKDSPTRPGKPLRDLLRAKKIIGGRQEPNRRWFIDRVK